MISNIAENSETALMSSIHRLSDAGGSVLHVKTREPLRAALVLRKHLIGGGAPHKEWDAINGVRVFTCENLTEHSIKGDGKDFMEALLTPLMEIRNPVSVVNAQTDRIHYFVYVDAHPWLANNPIASELIQQYAAILPATNICLILVTPDCKLDGIPAGTTLVTDLMTPTADELKVVLERIIKDAIANKDDFDGKDLTKDDLLKIANMGLGLSLFEFETYTALAIIEAGEAGERRITKERMMSGIAKGKTAIVRQSEILELTHPEDIENVGGMGKLKDWIAARALCYSEEAKAFGVEAPRGMVLVGVPGCLAGDTIINILYTADLESQHEAVTLEVLYRRMQSKNVRYAAELTELGVDMKVYTTSCMDQDLGDQKSKGCCTFYNEIIDVISSGFKEVFNVITYQGRSVRATADHRFLTPRGYVPVEKLIPGDEVIACREDGGHTHIDKVMYVKPAGKVNTYDISMKAPYHNFVANGLVVHNCGKSLVAKVTASVLDVPLVKLDFGRVFSKFIGDSESRVREALKMIEGMAPVCCFVDEIDKGLGGAGGSGDAGTSSRVLGTFLTWLQECKAPVFVVVTANKIDGLPPELLRRGRFDQIWSVSMPDPEERREVLEIHLRKRNRSIEEFSDGDVEEFIKASEGYIPAEIESSVKDGLIVAFNDVNAEGLEMRHLIAALKDMVPMSRSHKEAVDRICAWAASNATPVSYPRTTESLRVGASGGARVIRPRRRG